MQKEHLTEASTASRSANQTQQPLLSAADIPRSLLPTITIPDRRYIPLTELGTRRARADKDINRHIQGILGEFAIASYLEQEESINTEIYEDGGDGGVDLSFRGYDVDVKTAGRGATSPRLMVDADRPLTADFYILVQELGRCSFQPIGYAPVQWVATARTTTVNPGYYTEEVRVLEQDQLIPLPPTGVCSRG